MNRTHVRLALAAVAACAATPLLAQVPSTMAPPPQAVAPVTPPPKRTSFQVGGAMTIPAFSYNDFLADIGWQAQGALVLRQGPFNHVRLEGEYNCTEYANSNQTGCAELYGGGVGGGRVVTKGNTQTEGYLVVGLYNHAYGACTGSICATASELQFGTKLGFDAVMGRGKVRPVLDFHWLSTWSQPYATLFTIGAGLRF